MNKHTKDGKDYLEIKVDPSSFPIRIQIRIEEEQIIISNRCILPEGWTAETLMQPHDSIPYNPDIANVFYRAGYIETWGQGIQKICDECKALGAELPRYEILGTGIRVYFPAFRSELIDCPIVSSKVSSVLALKIIGIIRRKPDMRYMNTLKETGLIECVGGKRYGHWEVRR